MTKASIRGFFRVAFGKQGRWPEAIHELVDEWTMFPAPEAIAQAKAGALLSAPCRWPSLE